MFLCDNGKGTVCSNTTSFHSLLSVPVLSNVILIFTAPSEASHAAPRRHAALRELPPERRSSHTAVQDGARRDFCHSLSTARNVSWLWENSVNGTLEVTDQVVRGHMGGFSLRRLPVAPSPHLEMLEVKLTVRITQEWSFTDTEGRYGRQWQSQLFQFSCFPELDFYH